VAWLSFIHASSDGQFASPGYTLHLEVGFASADPARKVAIQYDRQKVLQDRRVILAMVSFSNLAWNSSFFSSKNLSISMPRSLLQVRDGWLALVDRIRGGGNILGPRLSYFVPIVVPEGRMPE
jgi:hypothetical protein